MDALISGRAGVAVVVAGSRLVLIQTGLSRESSQRDPVDLEFVLADVDDLQPLENAEFQEIQHRLERSRDTEESLHLVLILLDSDLSASARQEAATALENALVSSDVDSGLKSVLFAQNLPASVNIDGAIEVCESVSATATQDLLKVLETYQPDIRTVRHQWDAIATSSFGSEEDRVHFRAVAVKEGLFRDLVGASHQEFEIDQVVSEALLNPYIIALPNHFLVLQQWMSGFSTQRSSVPAPRRENPVGRRPAGGAMKVVFFSRSEARVEEMVLALRLRWPDIQPTAVDSGDQGLHIIEQLEPELVVVCDDLNDMAILEIVREIRRFADTPILVASDGVGEMDIVKALEAGADDYIITPSNMMTFMARSVALLRRVGLARREADTPIRFGELLIDPANYEVFVGDRRIVLTPTELKLLSLLVKRTGT